VQHTVFNAPVTADTKASKTAISRSVSIQNHRLLEYKTLNTRRMKSDNKHYRIMTWLHGPLRGNGRHVSAATDTHAKVEELLGAVFHIRSLPRLLLRTVTEQQLMRL
jgi:hypothetical protein